ncbi:ATPase [Heyndrickxia ginsengihumi]|uniref:histidine kinase n=1 Tax=Heyndrickxia ginsengihumi TaxID=363870 RepID=A0A0A6VCY4_9BACI|nr:sensor histidine kinase [Heyndrickxia ginsengihumi]KHD85328.1 ATPase [Heyndrickxia ginsengihumi]
MHTLKVSLQTKILGFVLLLTFFITTLLTVYFMMVESKQIEEQKGRLALEISKTVANMPTIIQAFQTKNPSKTIQPLAEKIRKQTGAEFIVVGNKKGIRYSHPIKSRIGKKMIGGDNKRAIVKGESYISKAKGSLGASLRGKAPIFNQRGEIIGVVSVGFMLEDIQHQMYMRLMKVVIVAVIALIVSILGSVLLARNIRKDTMGLEPYEIAALYKEKRAILHAVKEGILAIDEHGFIITMNQPAKQLLHINRKVRQTKVDQLIPAGFLYEVLDSKQPQTDAELIWKDKILIVNTTPILNEQGEISGVVASFRDKSEVEDMVNTLSEVRKYSEDLRAQTHEFTNKLHVISGLLQLGEYDEVIQMIQEETAMLQSQHKLLFEQIKDAKVQAIILGKLGKASEKKISLEIDTNSDLRPLPKHIKLSQLIVIIGNLIDNAFEAVAKLTNPLVIFFATDIGEDMIIEISDNGNGITGEEISHIFERGFTTKTNRAQHGFGLANVKEAVDELGGYIEVHSKAGNGTTFTVYIPKRGGESRA